MIVCLCCFSKLSINLLSFELDMKTETTIMIINTITSIKHPHGPAILSTNSKIIELIQTQETIRIVLFRTQ